MRRSREWTFPIANLCNTNSESNHCSGPRLLHLIDCRLYHQCCSPATGPTRKLHWAIRIDLFFCTFYPLPLHSPGREMYPEQHAGLCAHSRQYQSYSLLPVDQNHSSKVCFVIFVLLRFTVSVFPKAAA